MVQIFDKISIWTFYFYNFQIQSAIVFWHYNILLMPYRSNITNQQSIMNHLMSPSFSNISSTLPYACSPDQEKQDRIATRDSVDLTILPQENHQVKKNRLMIFGFSKKQQGKNEPEELCCLSSDIQDGLWVDNYCKDTQRIHMFSRKHENNDQKCVTNERNRKKRRIFQSSHLKKAYNEFQGREDESGIMMSSTKRLKEKIDQIIQRSSKENVYQSGYEKSRKRYSFECQDKSDFNHYTTENAKKTRKNRNMFKTVQCSKDDHIKHDKAKNTPIYQSFICRDDTSRYTFEQANTQHKNPAIKKIKNSTKTMRRIDNTNNEILDNKKSILLSQFSPQNHAKNKLNQNSNNTKIGMTQQRYYDKQAQTSRFQQKISYRNIDILKQNQNNEENVNVVTHNLFVDFESSRRCSAFNTPEILKKNKSSIINQVFITNPVNKQQHKPIIPKEQSKTKIPYIMIALALVLLLLQIVQ